MKEELKKMANIINKIKINGVTYKISADTSTSDPELTERVAALEAANNVHLINALGMAIATKDLVETPGYYLTTPKTGDLTLVSNGELYALTVAQDEMENLGITATLLGHVPKVDVDSELAAIKSDLSELEEQVGGGTSSAGGSGLSSKSYASETGEPLVVPIDEFTGVKFATLELIYWSTSGGQQVVASWVVTETMLLSATVSTVTLPTQTVSVEEGSDTTDCKLNCKISQTTEETDITFTPSLDYLPDRSTYLAVTLYK